MHDYLYHEFGDAPRNDALESARLSYQLRGLCLRPGRNDGASAFRHEEALACEALEAAGLRE